MKKVTVFILTFILFIPIVNGKNINDLYGELNALESQKNLYSYLNSEDIKSLSIYGFISITLYLLAKYNLIASLCNKTAYSL